ncbi:MAG: YdcF family protein [Anaerolineaceae bacterium]|nr:YdcF family protein [Anaerolineaceae bacterium]
MNPAPETPYDAILIPGGGLTPAGELPPWVIARLQKSVEIAGGGYFVVLSAGTVHKPPPLDAEGFPIFESRAAAEYLLSQGVGPDRILIETSSYDTIGNAYFSRVVHVEPRQFSRLLVVTSAFHAARTEIIFRWVYGLDEPAAGYTLDFQVVPDAGMSEAVLAARAERERSSIEQVKILEKRVRTLAQLHKWMFSEHEAYTAGGRAQRLTGEVLGAY